MQSRTTSLALDRKERLATPPQPAPRQPAVERTHNWNEVFLGFDPDSARAEAQRCIQCPAAPCTKACPLHNDIPGAFWHLERGDTLSAAEVFRQTSNMPEICGRVCPQEKLCEGACVVGRNGRAKPVQIGKLEQFCADFQRRHQGLPLATVAPSTPTVAIVGAGPAGLAAAEELVRLGHAVTVLDAWPRPGGTLRYGIPSFKLDKTIIDAKVAQLEAMGVEFVTSMRLHPELGVRHLLDVGYGAVFLAFGAVSGNRLGIPGEDLSGVHGATEFLVRANLSPSELPAAFQNPLSVGERVIVIGGGDTAMDCVRSAVRLGAKTVSCVYRRSEAEMPGRKEERQYAREEGVQFHFLAAPLRLLGEVSVGAVEFIGMELAEPDARGRRSVRPVAGSEFTIAADTVVVAAGYHVDETMAEALEGVETRSDGVVVVNSETGATNVPGVFAGGDLTSGPDLVVTAVAAGRRAARAIHEYIGAAG
ncbi:MAG: NAD(P)-dependent oxidoreductase [Chloroflexi bacterium]|nr:NAD(P)-dependent oxidoreductase [Chloroflexota bacterium]